MNKRTPVLNTIRSAAIPAAIALTLATSTACTETEPDTSAQTSPMNAPAVGFCVAGSRGTFQRSMLNEDGTLQTTTYRLTLDGDPPLIGGVFQLPSGALAAHAYSSDFSKYVHPWFDPDADKPDPHPGGVFPVPATARKHPIAVSLDSTSAQQLLNDLPDPFPTFNAFTATLCSSTYSTAYYHADDGFVALSTDLTESKLIDLPSDMRKRVPDEFIFTTRYPDYKFQKFFITQDHLVLWGPGDGWITSGSNDGRPAQTLWAYDLTAPNTPDQPHPGWTLLWDEPGPFIPRTGPTLLGEYRGHIALRLQDDSFALLTPDGVDVPTNLHDELSNQLSQAINFKPTQQNYGKYWLQCAADNTHILFRTSWDRFADMVVIESGAPTLVAPLSLDFSHDPILFSPYHFKTQRPEH